MTGPGPLSRFGAPTRTWFTEQVGTPTAAQQEAWSAIADGESSLVIAPTGSGKTFAAFLWALDRLLGAGGGDGADRPPEDRPATRVLYLSPLKALGVDVERNLQVPLAGITAAAAESGTELRPVRVGVRSGDTTPAERRRLVSRPPEILITTPESLFILLTSSAARTLTGIDTVIVDEVHAVAGTKRGTHLALSLERLDDLLAAPAQRIGLSATVEPAEEVARFLGGSRPVRIVRPQSQKTWDLTVRAPVPDLADLARDDTASETDRPQRTVWPAVGEQLLDLILAHTSTLVFANSRRTAEKVTARLNELWSERLAGAPASDAPEDAGLAPGKDADDAGLAPAGAAPAGPAPPTRRAPAETMGQSGTVAGAPTVLARSHHGSVSHEQRAEVEQALKDGRLACVVATSSLELGIDMGAIDLVVQLSAPPSVSSGLQRIGRAGHRVGAPSNGVVVPLHPADVVTSGVVVERMRAGLLEPLRVPRHPLDVLAQQTVAAAVAGPLDVAQWFATVRRAAAYADLPRSAFDAVLDLLSGRYPSDDFAELRPRLVRDHEAGTLLARPGAQRLAVTSGGTIPDRGLYPVFLAGADEERGARRVGELDEEMVFESRPGDVIALGASGWRIEEITHERVVVTPAPGQAARAPFWHGEADGRHAALGEALGAFVREARDTDESDLRSRLETVGLDAWARDNLVAHLDSQRRDGALPDDRTIVVERFRAENGDWRVVLLSPWGKRVHAPWALAVQHRLRVHHGLEEAVAMAADDGIALTVPETDGPPPGAELFLFDPDELERTVDREVTTTGTFAIRFRESAQRALLLPRRDPTRRSPLWQQRKRSRQLLQVASRHPDFPIVLEAAREVLQDAWDLPALLRLTRALAAGEAAAVEAETERPSPFARSLLFGYVGEFMYDPDLPLAERRAAAMGVDQNLLADLLGRIDLAELLDPGIIADTEARLQRTHPERRARDTEGVADLLRLLGPLSAAETAARLEETAAWLETEADEASADAERPDGAGEEAAARLEELVDAGRAFEYTAPDGIARVAAVEDAARLRDALGTGLPDRLPAPLLEPVPDPVGDLVSRFARTHGPFTIPEAAGGTGLGPAIVGPVLHDLVASGRVVAGRFRETAVAEEEKAPDRHAEFVDAEVLQTLRRRSLAAARAALAPVDQRTYAAFLADWHGLGAQDRLDGEDGLLAAVEQLAGARLPAGSLESLVLPARLDGPVAPLLDAALARGDLLLTGAGRASGGDLWVRLHVAHSADETLPTADDLAAASSEVTDPLATRVLTLLRERGGAFRAAELQTLLGEAPDEHPAPAGPDLAAALWNLAEQGLVTTDSAGALRAHLRGGGAAGASAPATGVAPTAPRPATMRRRGRRRPRYDTTLTAGTGSRLLPPAAQGRWQAVRPSAISSTERATATAQLLLDRHGVVVRGAVDSEELSGGFSAQYRILSALEDRGLVRRGYLVAGLGGAQFAEPAVIDALRAVEETADVLLLSAADPANPYGAALPWPEPAASHRPARRAGAVVVLRDGALLAYLERGGRTLLTGADQNASSETGTETGTETGAEPDDAALAAVLVAGVRDGRLPDLGIETIDGAPATTAAGRVAALRQELLAAGFYTTPRALRCRR